MADDADIARVRLALGPNVLDDATLGQIIDASSSDDYRIWIAESWDAAAARYHALVNISESGSSRSMGDMYKNALSMAAGYRKQVSDEAIVVVTSGRSTTRRITRI
jgi:hypothetical protein